MTIRLYFDEDSMRHALVRALRIRGMDVVTALECDLIEQSDEANLEFATAQGRTLYSYNIGDYYRLHTRYLTANKPHAGIILAPQQRYTVGQQMRRLLKISATLSDRDMKNRLEFLSDW
jgi:uncharacterized protein with PIN domain